MAIPLLICVAALSASCVAVRFNEMDALRTRAMTGRPDSLGGELRGHVLSPREAAVGGFSSVGAGGCGCH